MARDPTLDILQVFPFWLMDVAPVSPLALPLFTPLLGFSSITAPEMQMEMTEINECNRLFTKKTIKRARCSTMTLSRGIRFFDGDFYRWISSALTGRPQYQALFFPVGGPTARRDMLLIQFFARTPLPTEGIGAFGTISLSAASLGILAAEAGAGVSLSTVGQLTAVTAAQIAQVGASIEKDIFAVRVPARAWILYGCIPTRYKPSEDFDASSGGLSVAEIDIEPEEWEEVSLGTT